MHVASWNSCRMRAGDIHRALDLLCDGCAQHARARLDVVMMQEVLVDGAGTAAGQQGLRDYVPHAHEYGTLHLVTLLHASLAQHVQGVVSGCRWFDVLLKLRGTRLHVVNVHMPATAGSEWFAELVELRTHLQSISDGRKRAHIVTCTFRDSFWSEGPVSWMEACLSRFRPQAHS